MKFLIFLIIATQLISIKGYGKVIKDSSGVYITKGDFIKNKLSYCKPYRLKEKFGFLNSDFQYEARGVILLKNADKETLSFEPGKIYGFYSNGKKFLYIPDIKRYLLILNEEPVAILMGEETTFYRFNTHTDLLLFYLDPKNVLKPLNKDNLNADFKNENNKLKVLMDIGKKLKEGKNKRFNPQKFSEYIKEEFSLKN